MQKPKDTPSRVDSNSCGPALASRRAKKPRRGFFSSAARRNTRAHQKSATPPVPDPLRHFASEMPPLPKGEALAVRKGLLAFIKTSPHCIHTTAKVTAVCYIQKTTRKTSGFLHITKQRRCKTVSAKCFIQRILGRCQKRLSPRSGSCRSSQRGQAGPHRASPSFRKRNATSPEGRGFGSAERSPCLYKDLPALHPHHCQGYGCLLYTENHPQNEWFSSYNKAETVQDRLCQMFYTANPGAMPEKAQPSIRLLPVISAGTGRPT